MKSKTRLVIIFVFLCMIHISTYSQVSVLNNGNVGIGTETPAFNFEVKQWSAEQISTFWAGGSNKSEIWAVNDIFAHGIQVDDRGWGHIVSSLSSPQKVMSFDLYQNIGIHCDPISSYRLKIIGNVLFQVSGNYYSGIEYREHLVPISPTTNLPLGVFTPKTDGQGGLGTPEEPFYQVYTQHIYRSEEHTLSDISTKENIKGIPQETFSNLLNLKAYTFDYKASLYDSIENDIMRNHLIDQAKNKIGFIAQDVKNVFPSLTHLNPDNNLLYINYDGFIPLLTEAVKSLSNQNDAKDEKIADLQFQINELKQQIEDCCSSKQKSLEKGNLFDKPAELFQNIPNPFNVSTEINFYVPKEVSNAAIYIYNMQGTQIKCVPVHNRGNASITIQGAELKPGMYMYSLIADGKEIDTKRMILTAE